MEPTAAPPIVAEPADPCTPTQSDSAEPTKEEPQSDIRMRRKLRFFFMNPIEKFQAKGHLPWKLGLQVVKILLVTLQLVFFGYDSYAFQRQHRDTNMALDHMFLEGWTSVREVASYPPSTGPYAVYTKKAFYSHLNAVVRRYTNVTKTSIASFGYDTPNGTLGDLTFCTTQYKQGRVNPHKQTLIFDNTQVTKCLVVERLYPMNDERWQAFSMKDYMAAANFSLSFERLIKANVLFSLKTVYLKSLSTFDLPECYKYNVDINYNNKAHDGQLIITLSTASIKLTCKNNVHYAETSQVEMFIHQFMNGIVIFVCSGSLILCARSLLRGQALRRQTEVFFWQKSRTTMSWSDKLDFVDFWYVIIITNDVLIIIGSLIKVQLEQRIIDGAQYNFCSTLLGFGNLLVWAGVLRYLGFFRKYNILILTMKRATPNILRFLLCAMLLYMGFCFCGWVVLGPHNIKFRSLSSTSECLFALMNGDDMFATFAIMGENSGIIWWFARIYLYMFLLLFIYCVISLFLSVIMDSYETIRESYERNGPPSDLWKFINEDDTPKKRRRRSTQEGRRRQATEYSETAPPMGSSHQGKAPAFDGVSRRLFAQRRQPSQTERRGYNELE
ncbi:mucolipin-3-like [Tropilaelaps mercedesae]|uniref:Mucolipin-3-like n=1 Tax=Tropilaelaps mercedesae TaxID=418985 RepID=A0A1V9XWJ8_9ACAR|nr:mucolipin-3-like [Tropilaelaps mercedesae]